MANQEQLEILKRGGVIGWNTWREVNPKISPDLRHTNLFRADLRGIDLRGTYLMGAILTGAYLTGAALAQAMLAGASLQHADLSAADLTAADLSYANFQGAMLEKANLEGANADKADFGGAYLMGANLSKATLLETNLNGANLTEAILKDATLSLADLSESNLTSANLTGANLQQANLTGANLTKANLTDCSIHGVSVWDVQSEGATQKNLIITSPDQPTITVDNLEVAQFIYLLLNNKKIRDVIDTITSKVVLILGRFTPERKAVLDALRDELRKHNYSPVVFDFDKPENRDLTETVSTLAHLARFIIVDLTDPSSAPHEVATFIPQTVVPVQPLLTVQPLIVEGKAVERHEYAMFEDLRRRYHWVLPTFRYQDIVNLLASLQEHIIEPAELKAQELKK